MRLCGLTVAAMLGLMIGAAGQARAGFILGSTVNGSISNLATSFSGSTPLIDPGVEFAVPVNLSFFGPGVRAIADLTATTVRVGVVADGTGGFAGASSSGTIGFALTGLTLRSGEFITGLSVLANGRNIRTPDFPDATGAYTFSTTANSISIQLQAFALGINSTSGDNDDSITFAVVTNLAVPEPSSIVLCGIAGIVGLIVAKGRRKWASTA